MATPLVFDIIGRDRASAVLDKVGKKIDAVGGRMDTVGRKASFLARGTVFAGGAAAAVGQIAKIGMAYEDNLNILQSVTGASAAQMAQVSAKARQLGADVKLPGVSAAGAAEAMTELAKSGLNVQQSMDAARATLQLARVASMSEAKAAEIAGNAVNAFGLKAKDVGFVVDGLANAANKSSLEVSEASDSFKMAAAVFAGFQGKVVGPKEAIAELTTAIAVLGNAGIKGSDAGTSLKQMLLQLTGPSHVAKDAMQALYISAMGAKVSEEELTTAIGGTKKKREQALLSMKEHNKGMQLGGDIAYDASGKMRPLREIIDLTARGVRGMNDEQRNQALTTVFGADATRAMIALMKGGLPAYDAMHQAILKQGGAADFAAAKNRGLRGAIDNVKSQIENASISVYNAVKGPMTAGFNSIADGLAGAQKAMGDFFSSSQVSMVKGWASALIGDLGSAFSTGDWAPVGRIIGSGITRSIEFVGDQAQALTEKLSAFVDKVDWGKLGSSVGSHLSAIITGAAGGGKDDKGGGSNIGAAILAMFAKIDWLQLGKDVAKIAVPFVFGFVPAFLDNIVTFIITHPIDALKLAAAIIPVGRISAALGPIARSIPIVGRVFGPILEHLATGGKLAENAFGAIFRGLGKVLDFIAPGVRKKISDLVSTVVTTMFVHADDMLQGGRRLVTRLADGIGAAASAVRDRVYAVISAHILVPVSNAAGALFARAAAAFRSVAAGVRAAAGVVFEAVAYVVRGVLAPFAAAGRQIARAFSAAFAAVRSAILAAASVILGALLTVATAASHIPGPFKSAFKRAADAIAGAKAQVDGLRGSIDKTHGKTVPVTVTIKGQVVTAGSAAHFRIAEGWGGTPGRASGGWIPGTSPNARADDKLIRVTSDEYMIQQPAARWLRQRAPGLLEALNNAHRLGGDPGAMILRSGSGYAFGGSVGEAGAGNWLAPFLGGARHDAHLAHLAHVQHMAVLAANHLRELANEKHVAHMAHVSTRKYMQAHPSRHVRHLRHTQTRGAHAQARRRHLAHERHLAHWRHAYPHGITWGQIGERQWNALMAAGWRGKRRDGGEIIYPPGLAKGGWTPGRIQSLMAAQVGKPYVWGATGPGAYDCSGLGSLAYAAATGKSLYRRYFTTSSIGGTPGLKRGRGTLTFGATGGPRGVGHMAGQIGGLKFEATPPRVKIGSGARSVNSFGQQYTLGGSFSGAAGGMGPDQILTGRQFNTILKGLEPKIVRGLAEYIGFRSFDSGGWLPPGLTLAHNGTGRPERVGAGGGYTRLHPEDRLLLQRLADRPVVAVVDRAEVGRAADDYIGRRGDLFRRT